MGKFLNVIVMHKASTGDRRISADLWGRVGWGLGFRGWFQEVRNLCLSYSLLTTGGGVGAVLGYFLKVLTSKAAARLAGLGP